MNSRGFQKQAFKVSLVVIFLCVMALNSGLNSTAQAQAGLVTTRVSVASNGTEGNDRSELAAISANGRYVAFSSLATNLVLGDANGVRDVFLYDNETKVTTRVSVDSNGAEENATSSPLASSISADGRYIVFSSLASNIVLGDTNGVSDVFLHDMQTGETKLVSVNSDGVQGDDSSGYSSISANGRYVAFSSYAGNLVSGGGNRRLQVYRHDMFTGLNVSVSVDVNGTWGNDTSFSRSISADGRYIAFSSYASNLVSGDTNLAMDAFVHDTQTGITTRVSVDSYGIQANSASDDIMQISGNGRYVMFGSLASNLVLNDTNEVNDVFLHDMQTGTTTRVSVDSNGIQGNSHSYTSSISSDGRYVSFSSSASNLVPGDTLNQYSDTFVHDMQTGEIKLVSVNSDCIQGNGNSGYSSISADGRYIAFESFADNLVSGDTNGTWDIFVHDSVTGVCGTPTPTFTPQPSNDCLLPNFCNTLYDQTRYNNIRYAGQLNAKASLVPFAYNEVTLGQFSNTDYISDWGCTITSLVTVINYYARQNSVIDPVSGKIFQTDPQTLNAWMQKYKAYESGTLQKPTATFPDGYFLDGFVDWDSIASYASSVGISSIVHIGARNDITLDANLTKTSPFPNPVLLEVANKNTRGHWIVALAKTTENGKPTYQIYDPDPALNAKKQAITTLLDGYNGSYFAMAVPQSGTPTSSLHIVSDPAGLLIMDSQGRQTGLDPATGNTLAQIPYSNYTDNFLSSDTSGALLLQKELDIENASSGSYKLQIIGLTTGTYSVDIVPFDSLGMLGVPLSISGVQTPGAIETFFLVYTSVPDRPATIQREVKIDIKPGSDPAPIAVGSNGIVPVALLSSSTFNASTVDYKTVRFGPNNTLPVDKQASILDVNLDGFPDLVIHFDNTKTGITMGMKQACLTGKTKGGLSIVGCDAIFTVLPTK
jgi:hypothetical protein